MEKVKKPRMRKGRRLPSRIPTELDIKVAKLLMQMEYEPSAVAAFLRLNPGRCGEMSSGERFGEIEPLQLVKEDRLKYVTRKLVYERHGPHPKPKPWKVAKDPILEEE